MRYGGTFEAADRLTQKAAARVRALLQEHGVKDISGFLNRAGGALANLERYGRSLEDILWLTGVYAALTLLERARSSAHQTWPQRIRNLQKPERNFVKRWTAEITSSWDSNERMENDLHGFQRLLNDVVSQYESIADRVVPNGALADLFLCESARPTVRSLQSWAEALNALWRQRGKHLRAENKIKVEQQIILIMAVHRVLDNSGRPCWKELAEILDSSEEIVG